MDSSRSKLDGAKGRRHASPSHSKADVRLLASYVLDLLPAGDLPAALAGFRRVLRPGGRMVIVSLTEGVTAPSRLIVALWKAVYSVSPLACGGCRPLQLSEMVCQAGFDNIEREVIVQLGVPSEIVIAT